MKSIGIKRQALMIALVPILLMAAMLEGYGLYMHFDDLDQSLMERSISVVKQLAISSEYAVFSGNTDLLKFHMDATLVQRDVNRIIVYDGNKNELMASAVKNASPESLPQIFGVKANFFENKKSLWLYEPIVPTEVNLNLDALSHGAWANSKDGDALGGVLVEISKERLNRRKADILVAALLITLGVSLISLIVAFRVARIITGPIIKLNDAIRDIGEGKLDTRIQALGVNELDQLAGGVNAMSLQLQNERNTLQMRIEEATEQLRRKKEQAEDASQDKSRFLAAASHDLRQPMQALVLFISLLRDKVDTSEQIELVRLIESSAEAMSSLLGSLLDISKLDAGLVVPHSRPMAIAPLLFRLEQEYVPLAVKHGVTLKFRLYAARVVSDVTLLERILINFIGNAIRYTDKGGRVLVACRRRGNYLRIEVRDNGIGIPYNKQQYIFREFVQLGNVERSRDKGLGLGLAIVDRLAKLLQHPLSLRSETGRGSVFSVTVPLVGSEAGEGWGAGEQITPFKNESFAVEIGNFGGVRALVVDDDELVLSATCRLLDSWGCSVFSASSVAEACQQLADIEIDLLICDYRLPDGVGLDVVRRAARISRNHVVSILVSGDTGTDVLQMVSAEGWHLLHKPVHPMELHSLMSHLLHGKH
ncbi:MAG: response regulator [Nitrosomonadales bacterium]|nr:response regulator [Nitrosomonadales bacterium]